MAEQPKKKKIPLYTGEYYRGGGNIRGQDWLEPKPIDADTLGAALFNSNKTGYGSVGLVPYNVLGNTSPEQAPQIVQQTLPVNVARNVFPGYTALRNADLQPNSYIRLAYSSEYDKKITDELNRQEQLRAEAARKAFIDYQRQHPITTVPILPFEIQRRDPYAGNQNYDGAVAGYGMNPDYFQSRSYHLPTNSKDVP